MIPGRMLALADLTGRFLSHGVWCVSDPETFIPLIGHEKAGKRGMLRLAGTTLEDSVASGKAWLTANPESVERAVLVFDALLTLPDGTRRDALFARAVEYAEGARSVDIVVAYLPGGTAKGFRVGSPKVIGREGFTDADFEPFFAQFWAGVKGHVDAAKVWAKALDDTL